MYEEFTEQVAHDLRYLRETWDRIVEDSELRRGSAVLRRLLVDNLLQRAWRQSGLEGEPQILASTLEPVISGIREECISLAAAGGAEYHGMEVRGSLCVHFEMDLAAMREKWSQGVPETTCGVKAFTEATCLVLHGRRISRRQLIKHVANRMGGVHAGDSGKQDAMITTLLDSAHEVWCLAEKSVVYYELLSIGQALVRAPDIVNFCNVVGHAIAAPPPAHCQALQPHVQSTSTRVADSEIGREECLYASANDLANLARGRADRNGRVLRGLAFERYAEAVHLRPDYHAAMTNWAALFLDEAEISTGDERRVALKNAVEKSKEALTAKPSDSPHALATWGIVLTHEADHETGKHADELFDAAIAKFAESISHRETHQAYYDWGNALAGRARRQKNQNAVLLFDAAIEKYRRATALKNDYFQAWNNWGNVLIAKTDLLPSERRDSLLDEAIEKFDEALRSKSDPVALLNSARALVSQACTRGGEEAHRLCEEAIRRCEGAIQLDSIRHQAHVIWANARTIQSRTTDDPVLQRVRFAEAHRKYRQAVHAKPDYAGTHRDWSTAYLNQSGCVATSEARKLLNNAERVARKAEKLKPGCAAYNIACVAALLGDYDNCREWLDTAHNHDSLPRHRGDIESDDDLKAVRDMEWFHALLAEAFPDDDADRSQRRRGDRGSVSLCRPVGAFGIGAHSSQGLTPLAKDCRPCRAGRWLRPKVAPGPLWLPPNPVP